MTKEIPSSIKAGLAGVPLLQIPFTQYLRPDGRTRKVRFAVSGTSICSEATSLLTYGWTFECEVLTTGEVSLTVSDGDENRAIQVVPNGPDMGQAVSVLVMDAYKEMAEEAIAEAR